MFTATHKLIVNKCYGMYLVKFFLITILISCTMSYPTLETVASVDINRYAGKWYEIASFRSVSKRVAVVRLLNMVSVIKAI